MNVKIEYSINDESAREMIVNDGNFIDVVLSADSYLVKKGIISDMEDLKTEPGVLLKFETGFIKIFYTMEDL